MARGLQFPDKGLNPGPLPWKRGVLATGRPVGMDFCGRNFFFLKNYLMSLLLEDTVNTFSMLS